MNARLNGCEAEIKTGKLEQACQRYNLGKNYMRQVAEQAGAIVRVGKCVLYNFSILDKYMDSLADREEVK